MVMTRHRSKDLARKDTPHARFGLQRGRLHPQLTAQPRDLRQPDDSFVSKFTQLSSKGTSALLSNADARERVQPLSRSAHPPGSTQRPSWRHHTV